MPEDRGGAEGSDAAERSAEAAEAEEAVESDTDGQGVEAAETEDSAETDEAAAERRARLEAAKRSYRATLRNEADTGGGGFSEDYYRSQKPPHWS